MNNLITLEERQLRIRTLLEEIKREKPLGKFPLFKMTLTFRSFVWAPMLDLIYNTHCSWLSNFESSKSTLPSATTRDIGKPLQRSSSATSLKSIVAFGSTTTERCRVTDNQDAPQKLKKKDAVRLNMLATTINPVIKIKSDKEKQNMQTELTSCRSLELGAVPRYLTNRKAEWARQKEEKLKNLPDPDCPPGHVRMPESERLETLEELQKNHKEMIEEYNSLPVSKDTLRIRQKKEDIERKLIKVEEGIRILSKAKVFVRTEE